MFGGPECIGVGNAPGRDVRRHVFQVRGGHHGHHAGGLTGGRHLKRGEDGMGMGTAQHHGVQHTRERHIIDKLALTSEQTVVFKPFQRLTDVMQGKPPFPWHGVHGVDMAVTPGHRGRTERIGRPEGQEVVGQQT